MKMDLFDRMLLNAEMAQTYEGSKVFEADLTGKKNFAFSLLEQADFTDREIKEIKIGLHWASPIELDNIIFRIKERLNLAKSLEDPKEQIKHIFKQTSLVQKVRVNFSEFAHLLNKPSVDVPRCIIYSK